MTMPIRIMQIVNVMDRAGLETMLMNHYRAIDRSRVQFDFLTHRPQDGAYDDEIESLGGRVYRAPRLYPQNALSYRKYMRAFFAEHHYPIVHSHIDAMSTFPLAMARSCRVAVRIAHSHSDSVDRDLKYPVKAWARKRLPGVATHYWACSEAAGAFLFGETNLPNVHIVKNAIDLEGYRFDPAVRAEKRAGLGISKKQIVIGHVGRFSAVKNHDFLIDIMTEMSAQGIDATLVLVGDGELRHEIEQRVETTGIKGSVRFLGIRNDVASLMQAFDVLVFPSMHEGIPLTLIEAQASGLPIVTSDKVSDEALVLPNTARLSLDAPVREWAGVITQMAVAGRVEHPVHALVTAGYEINASAVALQEAYLSLNREVEI